MSLKSAIALTKIHKDSFQRMCKFEKQDFLTDVQVDDKKKDKAIQNITSLWKAETKPNWFPENLWLLKGGYNTMEGFSKAVCGSKDHGELRYEYLINWVVRCAFDASDFEYITPQYEGDGLEKPTLKFMEDSVSHRCGVGTACPDGLLKKDLMDIDGIPIEAKPAFKRGGVAYNLDSLRQNWTYESLAQIEGPLSSERRYGVGILSSWNHWVFMKAVRPIKEGQKMQVTWCSLQNDGLDSLEKVTTYILKTIQLFSSEESSDKDDSEADENKGQALKIIDEVESFIDGGESGAEQEPESNGIPPQTQTLKVTNHSNLQLFGGFNARLGYRQPGVNYGARMNPPTLNRGELIFLDVFSKKPPTLDEKISSRLDSNIVSDSQLA